MKELVHPVLASFHDADSRVRYYACEALYNIVKVCRGFVLPYFNEIFDGISKVGREELFLLQHVTKIHYYSITTSTVCDSKGQQKLINSFSDKTFQILIRQADFCFDLAVA